MKPIPLIISFLGLCCTLACRTKDVVVGDEGGSLVTDDKDFDGFSASEDCDDFDPAVNPLMDEACDGIDNNCNGEVDEGVTQRYFEDADGDGFGSTTAIVDACRIPEGYVPLANDCDDSDPTVFTGAVEICNDIDDDCDGEVDEDLLIGLFYDGDGDGFGDPNFPSTDCTRQDGYVFYGDDCNDSDPNVHPFNTEICDGIDNDCDGIVDNGSTFTFYEDGDQDGYGNELVTTQACEAPTGYVPIAGDCDDNDSFQYPNAEEYCNTEDDDCDGEIDEDPIDPPTWYYDIDGDGFGSQFITLDICTPPSGFIADNTDCDDTNITVYPGATEYCTNTDNDCNGLIDDNAIDASTWYADIDRDNFGNASEILIQCAQPFDYILTAGDCDDDDNTIYPNAAELCNGIDEDCDGVIDNDTINSLEYYEDTDGDGFGNPNVMIEECQTPNGYILDNSDCDDTDGSVYPGAPEFCDGIDSNCNGNNFYELDLDNNGALACEESVWFRNSTNNPTNPNGNTSQSAALLTNLGVSINQYYHGNNFITPSLLEDYGLFVHHGRNPEGAIRAYTNAEAGALKDWVYNGGRLLYMGNRYVTSCDIADSIPSQFGFSCTPSNGTWPGSTTTFTPHPITNNLSEIGGNGGEYWSVDSNGTALATIQGNLFVASVEYGEGKVVYVANELPFLNAGNGYKINYQDNQILIENIWTWLLEQLRWFTIHWQKGW